MEVASTPNKKKIESKHMTVSGLKEKESYIRKRFEKGVKEVETVWKFSTY